MDRELTSNESKAVHLVKLLEAALDDKSLTVSLVGNKDAAEVVCKLETKLKAVKTLNVNYNDTLDLYTIKFTTSEFSKYVDIILSHLKMKVLLDGSILTGDNYKISNTYLDN